MRVPRASGVTSLRQQMWPGDRQPVEAIARSPLRVLTKRRLPQRKVLAQRNLRHRFAAALLAGWQ